MAKIHNLMPRFLGGAERPRQEPVHDWDNETRAMQGVGEWLATIENEEGKFRVLTYWMWRLKSGESPNISHWVDSVAEQSAVQVAQSHGFREGVE